MRKVVSMMGNLLFPCKCIFCGKLLAPSTDRRDAICSACRKRLPYTVKEARCKGCGRPITGDGVQCELCRNHPIRPFIKISAPFLYQGRVKSSVVRFKQEAYRGYAKVYGKQMQAVLVYDCPDVIFDGVVAVPPNRGRYYDQAACLGRTLAKRMGIPFFPKVLKQRARRKKQSELSKAERWGNAMGNVLVVNPDAVKDKVILLTDDICTTGATLFAAAKALKEAGARRVYCVTVAMTQKG